MGKRGVKPQAYEEKAMIGSIKPCRDNKGLRRIGRSISAVPEAPKYLGKHGKEQWNNFLFYAVQIKGYISPTELGLIEQACQAWNEWREFVEVIEKEGQVVFTPNGVPMINPSYRIMEAAHARYYKIMRELGNTPTTRGGVKIIKEESKDDFSDLE